MEMTEEWSQAATGTGQCSDKVNCSTREHAITIKHRPSSWGKSPALDAKAILAAMLADLFCCSCQNLKETYLSVRLHSTDVMNEEHDVQTTMAEQKATDV